ncbi:LTA synthase family protein [Litchfieldia salsa]|uniref:Phosphoglycerol transferase MdoB n=1 Tax=Litchfieldia salsa TaxID=930152 RepID=A0A1H0WWL0_9BACI|nr:alkaline phosphatase family protein [Litchfieldia salsa]SDP94979.1 Phosphoglycerol transferase MdoB [Litchfieldia salsa]
MRVQKIREWFLLIIINSITAFIILFLYKWMTSGFRVDSIFEWIHIYTKRFTIIYFTVFTSLLLSSRFQQKVLAKIKVDHPKVVSVLKYLYIFTLSIVFSFIVGFYLQYFQKLGSMTETFQWIQDDTRKFLVGVLFIWFLYLLCYAIIGEIYSSTLITSIFLLTIGYAHYNKLSLRSEPLYPSDFKQMIQLQEVIPMIAGYLSMTIIFVFGILIVLFFILLKYLPRVSVSYWGRGILLIVMVAMIYSMTFFPKTFMKEFIKESNITIVLWNQLSNYNHNGFVFGFISNLQSGNFPKPENYSKERIIEIAEKYQNQNQASDIGPLSSEKSPNIVYIMSESFWDPSKLANENVEFSEDPLETIRALSEEKPSGQILSPAFGGATANVEFEALTGFSVSFLKRGSVPYQEMIDKKSFVPSIVSDLKNKGYGALAIHPFNRVFYKRNVVFDVFGFDQFLDVETMNYQERAGTSGSVISDESVSKEILASLRESEEPMFIHTITMQNHMPYNQGAYEENKIKISGLSEESTKTLEVFTEGIRQSDEALKYLVQELEELSEPTMVVFWGDHLPILGQDQGIYKEAGFGDEDPNRNMIAFSETPLLIYSNFEIENKSLNTMSPFYLGPITYELAGMEKPAFYTFLDHLRDHFPAIKDQVKINNQNEIVEKGTAEQEELLEEYKLIQYDLLVGKQYSLPYLFDSN